MRCLDKFTRYATIYFQADSYPCIGSNKVFLMNPISFFPNINGFNPSACFTYLGLSIDILATAVALGSLVLLYTLKYGSGKYPTE